MYYREFGIPARIAKCYDVEELEKQVAKYNGKKNCYASVYVFGDEKPNGKTDYESAMLNTIWFDFDDIKNVEKCLKDVRKFIRRFCNPLKITPRIYLTGGKGFQMNIDFHSPVDLPAHLKRRAIQEYLKHLKKKYYLGTLDDICINNSVSCMRRIVNTAYISKIEGIPTGVWCTQFTVAQIMDSDIAALYAIAMEDTGIVYPPIKSPKAQRNFVEFVCDMLEIKHTVSNSIDYLLNEIEKASGSIKISSDIGNDYIKPVRECIMKLIERNVERGHSSHEENNVIATELITAAYSNRDIHFVFNSIYDEPAGEWGWYSNDPNIAGRQIELIRSKALNRYSKDKLIQLGICTEKCGCL
tara:strand:+ start:264 stop:1331 length:1068 start_codon:yes stop_codon:yes gene_type:complete